MHKKNLLTQAARLILVIIFATAGFVPNGISLAQTPGITAKTGVEGKLSPRLYMLSSSPTLQAANVAEQAKQLSLPENGAGSLIRNEQGQLLVNIRMTDLSETQLQLLRRAGSDIVYISKEFPVVSANVDVSLLSSLANLPAVQYIYEQWAPKVNGNLASAKPSPQQQGSYACPTGIEISEGDDQLRASDARYYYNVSGSGVKIGVLSDTYNKSSSPIQAANDISSGDLPGPGNPCGYTTPISPNTDYTSGTDEGRGMLQLIHDLAPAAALSFATAYPTSTAFANNIRALRTAGADILVDDVSYIDEPFFQDGPVAKAINDVVTGGALYFTSAANNNTIIDGYDVSSYEAPAFRPGSCPAGSGLSGYCHDFDPGLGINTRSGVTLDSGGILSVSLQWAEPWYGITDDLNLYLVDGSGRILAKGNMNSIGLGEPIEYFKYTNYGAIPQNVYLVIHRYSGTGTPRLKYMFWDLIGASYVQYNISNGVDMVGPSLPGHSANKSAFSVAAAPFYDSTAPEDFSSRGPAVHYFGPVAGSTPAAWLTTPEIIQQPDFTATDGICTTFFSDLYDCYRFFGTSASAPHAAAVAALLKERANLAGVALTREVAKSILQNTAAFMSEGTLNSTGAGLLDAYAAVGSIDLPDLNQFFYLPMVTKSGQ